MRTLSIASPANRQAGFSTGSLAWTLELFVFARDVMTIRLVVLPGTIKFAIADPELAENHNLSRVCV